MAIATIASRAPVGQFWTRFQSWTRDLNKSPVYWLNGLARTEKSTIAQTISEKLSAVGQFGVSFFCSRDFEDRSNLKFILPTLGVQLAGTYAKFRSIFVPIVRSDPEITHESLYNQLDRLIVQPLVKSGVSTIIVIDAWTNRDEENASKTLSVLGQFVAKIPTVKVFLTGRPETRIREVIRLPPLVKATDVFVLHEVEPDQVNHDVRLLFTDHFSDHHRRTPRTRYRWRIPPSTLHELSPRFPRRCRLSCSTLPQVFSQLHNEHGPAHQLKIPCLSHRSTHGTPSRLPRTDGS